MPTDTLVDVVKSEAIKENNPVHQVVFCSVFSMRVQCRVRLNRTNRAGRHTATEFTAFARNKSRTGCGKLRHYMERWATSYKVTPVFNKR
ncbi:hypothetical protein J6590_033706 [Homalodisca vitripennis]|nr:hypothetical protein J6590_033706 [Homalodisca vitripennis]